MKLIENCGELLRLNASHQRLVLGKSFNKSDEFNIGKCGRDPNRGPSTLFYELRDALAVVVMPMCNNDTFDRRAHI